VGKQSVFEWPIELKSIAQSGSADLELAFWGFTYNHDINPDHDFKVAINDFALDPVMFDGQSYFIHRASVPTEQLTSGKNMLVIDNSELSQAPIDQFYLNWIALNYPVPTTAIEDALIFSGEEGQIAIDGFSAEPLVLDISNPLAPSRMDNISYADGTATFGVQSDISVAAVGDDGFMAVESIEPLLASSLRDTTQSGELLIVTTKTLAPALDPLVEAREAEGLSVVVTRVDELYDEFGHGAVTPDAITEFVKYAVESWAEPKPRYLFIVGDTTTDMLGYGELLPENPIAQPDNIVPSPIVQVSSAGETVADARLTDIDGDLKPDLAVGRWPVDTVRDVRNLVERTLAYESGVSAENALFTFDGTSSEFSGFTERLIDQSAFPTDHALLFDGPSSSQVTEEWNNGAWLVSYVGHGSLNMWGAEEVLTIDQIDQLGTSSDAPPIVLQFSCLTGQFAYPQSDSISEIMLKADDGPVLLVASTSLTLSAHQAPFATALVESLQNPTTLRVGDALQYAKAALQINGNAGLQEISDTFGLIGDPSAKVVRPDLFTQTVSDSP
ncbi:MAG: C25 family cysteine peptidase, partial [Candidatus Promineifilaceae bacterium]